MSVISNPTLDTAFDNIFRRISNADPNVNVISNSVDRLQLSVERSGKSTALSIPKRDLMRFREELRKYSDKDRFVCNAQIIADDDMTIGECFFNKDSVVSVVERSRGVTKVKVESLEGRTIIVEVRKKDKIVNIEKKIKERIRFDRSEHRLEYRGVVLAYDDTIEDSAIYEGSVIKVVKIPRKEMMIYLRFGDGSVEPLTVGIRESNFDVKSKIRNKIRLSPDELKLVFQGELLEDDKTLHEYHIAEHSFVDLGAQSRGRMTIFAKTMDGKRVAFEVTKYDTIMDIKKKIQEKTGLFPDEQNLVFHGELLKDDKTLHEYHIVENSFVDLGAQSRGRMTIFVKSIDGKRVALEVTKYDTIMDIKKKIYEKIGLRPEEQKLVYKGEILEDDKTVDDYWIREESFITVVARLRGGMQIFAKTMDGKTVAFEVTKYDTVMDIKKKIQEKIGLASDEQKLVYQGGILEDDKTVDEYQIAEKSVINVVARLRGEMQILAKTMDGKAVAIQVEERDTIMDIKKKIQERLGLELVHQILVHRGRILEDDNERVGYTYIANSTICVVTDSRDVFSINIKMVDSPLVTLTVTSVDTIIELKERIKEKRALSNVEVFIKVKGVTTENDSLTMLDCKIVKGDTIEVSTIERLTINILTSNMESVSLEVLKSDRVADLKKKIEKKIGLLKEDQILVLRGKIMLVDSKTVDQCQVDEKSDILVTVTLRDIEENIRGLCLVISNETFTNDSERRFDTRADEENIRKTFEPMGFETVIHRDVKQREMNVIFEETKNRVRESHIMLIVFILAHEEQGGFMTVDDEFVPLADVYRHFTKVNFPSFAKKPKLFFFAFCRGSERKAGACAARVPRLQYGGPSHDRGMFSGHATCMNDLSLRDTSKCTLYVQHLCEIIREHREWSVADIHQEVQTVLSEEDIRSENWYQVPYCKNMLSRATCFIDEYD